MTVFEYTGKIPSSKSMMNRALLVQSFFPSLEVEGHSSCDDVRHMKLAIVNLIRGSIIDCGEAGTVLRFMTARASRMPGTHRLKATPRLMQRPQDELGQILNPLGVEVERSADGLKISGSDWVKPHLPVRIPRDRSSQFASALLLSAWDLPFDLELELSGPAVSEGYWGMTLSMVKRLGMRIEGDRNRILVPAQQKVAASFIDVEPDYSSMFAVVAAALVAGKVRLQGVSPFSLQPDFVFFQFLNRMGVPGRVEGGEFRAETARSLEPLEASLRECPDLFPVLAALCSFASGNSVLREAPQLAHKESDRLANTHQLLRMAGVDSTVRHDGLMIRGQGPGFQPRPFQFDPDQDHRMAMAAALFKLRTPAIDILNPDVVKKSFPEFWSIVGLS